jgi:copper(I)-binding protein
MKLLTRTLPIIFLTTLVSHFAFADDKLEIDDAWIAEAPPVSKVMAAYMEIENKTGQDRQAVSMQCSEFERAEFHRTVEKDGMARMEHQPVLNIAADSELKLEPGGYHIMLFNPARHLPAGDKTNCSMKFDDGTTITVELEIKKSSVEDHSHHHHH